MRLNEENDNTEITFSTLWQSADLRIGRTRVLARSPAWSRECQTSPWGSGVSFPRYPAAFARLATGDSAVVNANHVSFFDNQMDYRRRRIGSFGEHNDVLWFAPHLARSILDEVDPGALADERFPNLSGPCHAALRRAQQSLFDYVEHAASPDPVLIEEAGATLLAHAHVGARSIRGETTKPRRVTTDRRHRDAVHGVIEHVSTHLDDPLTLAELSEVAGMARYHFCRVFRQVAGTSVHAYIRELRLQTALRRAANFRGRTVELALELGFASRSHLSSSFSRWYGRSLTRIQLPVSTRSARLAERLRAELLRLEEA